MLFYSSKTTLYKLIDICNLYKKIKINTIYYVKLHIFK